MPWVSPPPKEVIAGTQRAGCFLHMCLGELSLVVMEGEISDCDMAVWVSSLGLLVEMEEKEH